MTKYCAETTGSNFFMPIDTTSNARPPVTTAESNSLDELMRKAFFYRATHFRMTPSL